MVKSPCIDTSQDLVAEATYLSKEDLVAEEGRFLVKVQSESRNVAENLSVSRIFKEDLVAEERTSSLE